MKKLSLIAACVFTLVQYTGVHAADGPNLATLVPIDESKYDMVNKKSVDKTDVLNRLTKETYYREIFEVKEYSNSAYIVKETKPVARMVTDDKEVYVKVNKVPQVNTPGWSYINR